RTTTTSPPTARPTNPVTRRSSDVPCHCSAALSRPIRVDRPPASTTPAAGSARSMGTRCHAARRDGGSSGARVPGDLVAVPPAARLEGAAPGREVHVDDAEPLGVAAGPLEVVEQGPQEV